MIEEYWEYETITLLIIGLLIYVKCKTGRRD